MSSEKKGHTLFNSVKKSIINLIMVIRVLEDFMILQKILEDIFFGRYLQMRKCIVMILFSAVHMIIIRMI